MQGEASYHQFASFFHVCLESTTDSYKNIEDAMLLFQAKYMLLFAHLERLIQNPGNNYYE